MIEEKIDDSSTHFSPNNRTTSATSITPSNPQHFASTASALLLPYRGSTSERNLVSTSASVIGLPAWPRGNSTSVVKCRPSIRVTTMRFGMPRG